jgi:hypothetical protein
MARVERRRSPRVLSGRMLIQRGLSLAALLAALAGCSTQTATPDIATSSCVPGRQATCACAGGATGYQVCNETGTAYGPCLSCGQAPDAGPDSRGDSRGEGPASGSCIYPSDPPAAGSPQPTAGRCSGNNEAVTCDPSTHQMRPQPCQPDEECRTFDIEEKLVASPGRVYTWAACVPKGAKPCAWEWQSWTWASKTPGTCENDHTALWCRMAPVPDDLRVKLSAGTTSGYLAKLSCDTDEVCVAQGDLAACFLSPLQPCSTAISSCPGESLLYTCESGLYLQKVDCKSKHALSGHTVCRVRCHPDSTTSYAECSSPLQASAEACDIFTYKNTCADSLTLERCELCYQESGQCKCYTRAWSCSDLGCNSSSGACKCATVIDVKQTIGDRCIDAAAVLCDPATSVGSCNGDTAKVCLGTLVDYDCKSSGQTCKLVGTIAGCAGTPVTACTAGTPPTCENGKLVGCCPASGYFLGSGIGLPCAPGFRVRVDCSKIHPTQSCKALPFGFGAECSP